jgi:phenylalanyl-tRNA synthetase beta chain
MKISYTWLQDHIEEKLPQPKELAEKIIFHAFEVESVETVGDDTVFDIDILPNRASDCLSHAGIAREIAGLLNYTYKQSEVKPLPEVSAPVPLELKSDLCRKYIAVRIDGVKVGPSPDWLKKKLETIGQRSVNNIVDATNYVLFDVGQPIHAFDAANVDGGIVVRLAHDGETIKILGGEEKTLKETDLLISDYIGGIAIAGVKGGVTAEVSEKTTSIIIEVANFDPVSVRRTSRRLNLISDASKRFENNYSPLFARDAAAQVVSLILDLAGGTVSAISERGTGDVPERTVIFKPSDVARLLGSTVTEAAVVDVLARYHYSYTKDGDLFTLAIPHYRQDITGAHDIAEEVGRAIGYDTIPASSLPFTPIPELNETDTQISAVRAWALQNGYREVYTYAFRSTGEVSVAYGAKGKDRLRSNLSDGLKESYELNRLNAPVLGLKDVQLFEVGTVFLKDTEEVRVAICDKGTIQELPLSDFIKEHAIDTASQLSLGGLLTNTPPFKSWSTYPFITRDIAVWVQDENGKEKLNTIVQDFASKHCVREPYLFDTFSKEGRTSVAYRFVFQSFDKTLTDDEVSKIFDTLMETIKTDGAFEIR